MIPFDFQTLREGYERELVTLFDRIAAGSADEDTIRGFGLIAEIYSRALHTHAVDQNARHLAAWNKHVAAVEDFYSRQAAALERIATALEVRR